MKEKKLFLMTVAVLTAAQVFPGIKPSVSYAGEEQTTEQTAQAAEITSDQTAGEASAQETGTADSAAEGETGQDTAVSSGAIQNIRDLAGTVCANGYRIKPGVLLRSGELYELSASDWEYLVGEIGLSTIIDLRQSWEIEQRPDTPVSGVYNYRLEEILKDTEDFKGLNHIPEGKKGSGYAIQLLEAVRDTGTDISDWYADVYASDYLLNEDAIREYKLLFRLLEGSEGPVLIHSSLGKDRCGIAFYLILAALGADEEAIRQDYLASGPALRKSYEQAAADPSVSGDPEMARQLEVLYSAQQTWLDAAMAAVTQSYGSVEGFLRDGLGLTDNDFETLRGRYLEVPADPGTVSDGAQELVEATQQYLANAYVAQYDTITYDNYYDTYDNNYSYYTDDNTYYNGYTDYTDNTDYTDDSDYTDYPDDSGNDPGYDPGTDPGNDPGQESGGETGGGNDPSDYGELNTGDEGPEEVQEISDAGI